MSVATLRLRVRDRRPRLPKAFRKPAAHLGLALVIVAVLTALFAPWIAPHSPTESFFDAIQQPPSWRFPFGTDELGRCVLSRVIHGARISLSVALSAVLIGLSIGTLLGLLAGYFRGWLDTILMRVTDVMLAFPEILLTIAIVAILGPDLKNTVLAVGLAAVPVYARTVRSAVLQIRELEYIQAATALGRSERGILLRHILPNVTSPIIVVATVNVGTAILITAGLSYVGLGAQPPTPEWGAMLSASRAYLQNGWWIATFPGLAITMLVIAFNLIGDAARDVLDPRHRQR
ncbi:nickel transporter permease [Deinococcus peraridilitoris]|uniref:ABC-type dipeptide/oligopeptide/nickel transport system, permease component n=1 Tax=Deinococcus peraridilitoris (strain DSM 19664 / LMG 22246 / CIP 109416 / KR-200) TaxID=937777 RepID=L0A690_DEIPD|nr:nickel transporter permease [Deinococcus peraridilitoris]AFZ69403.1 ABC-type dipeptide/oligopeptide/nickel transport system, permease component [Deinococcus peraridilitoris DSM 19664]